MGKYCKLVMKAVDKGYGDEAWEVADIAMDRLEKADPEAYNEAMLSLEKLAYKINRDEAEQIVRNMRPKGQAWSYQQVVDAVKERGVTSDFCNWYLVMNMVYNDFMNTARAYGVQNDVDFFFSLAKDFIEDPDARPLKVEKYFLSE